MVSLIQSYKVLSSALKQYLIRILGICLPQIGLSKALVMSIIFLDVEGVLIITSTPKSSMFQLQKSSRTSNTNSLCSRRYVWFPHIRNCGNYNPQSENVFILLILRRTSNCSSVCTYPQITGLVPVNAILPTLHIGAGFLDSAPPSQPFGVLASVSVVIRTVGTNILI